MGFINSSPKLQIMMKATFLVLLLEYLSYVQLLLMTLQCKVVSCYFH